MKLMLGDCLERMKEIPDGSVDLVLTDPPYGIAYKTNYRKDKSNDFCSEIANDESLDVAEKAIRDLSRVMKKDSAAFVFASPEMLGVIEGIVLASGLNVKNRIVWNKNNWTAGDLAGSFGRKWEMIYLLAKGRPIIRGKRWPDVWDFKRVPPTESVHQNQKPIAMLERAILSFSDPGQVVLDPFMGSGSTGVACVNTQRDFVGIELDERYFEMARRRIEEAQREHDAKLF